MNTTTKPVYPTHRQPWAQYIASQLQRAEFFRKSKGDEARAMHIENALRSYVKKHGPSGSGIDAGTELGTSHPRRLSFITAFHHMDEHGGYDGWTNHHVIVTPDFVGFTVRVTGSNRNQIKDYLSDTYHHWLREEADHPALVEDSTARF